MSTERERGTGANSTRYLKFEMEALPRAGVTVADLALTKGCMKRS
jgi:hypothetical protein